MYIIQGTRFNRACIFFFKREAVPHSGFADRLLLLQATVLP